MESKRFFEKNVVVTKVVTKKELDGINKGKRGTNSPARVNLDNFVELRWMDMEKLINPLQLAEIIGVKPGTVYSWLSRGVDIPHMKISGTVRFREKAVQEWFAAMEKAKRKRNFEL